MRRITEVLEGLLVRDGMSAGSGGTDDAQGIGDGERTGKSALSHQPTGREDNQPMGMSEMDEMYNSYRTYEKGREANPAPVGGKISAEGRNSFGHSRSSVLRVHVNPNAHNMQARKMAVGSATFLTCIK